MYFQITDDLEFLIFEKKKINALFASSEQSKVQFNQE
jgi:hypothetical protein